MPAQTVIPIVLAENTDLESFFSEPNSILLSEIEKLLKETREKRVIYFWGEPGCGKSHLLNTCCMLRKGIGPAVYLSLDKSGEISSEILANITGDCVLCIDGVQNLAGNPEAQQSLLGMYEKVINSRGALIAAGLTPLSSIRLDLEDLKSRLSAGGSYRLHFLNDMEKARALKARANTRGFDLDDNVIGYIMSHYARDTRSLFAILDKLDSASLQEKRKITIPFVKSTLEPD